MKTALILTLALLIGCEKDSIKKEIDLTRYVCTEAQLDLVQKEFNICKESSYFSSHCFAQAKHTQCSPANPTPEGNE